MKKYLWIMALLAALSLAFVGCGGGEDNFASEIKLEQNPYGTDGFGGYQCNVAEIGAVKAGDKFTLNMVFTASRDVEIAEGGDGKGMLGICLVDRNPGSDNSYWHPLSYKTDNSVKMFYTGVLKKGELYTITTVLEVLVDSEAGGKDDQIVLLFQTEHEYERTAANKGEDKILTSGVPGNLIMKCPVFIFEKQ